MFCPTVFGDVTSANIVGYSTSETVEDAFTAITPTFVSISDETGIKLSELGCEFGRNDNIQMLNKDGDLIKKLTYKRRGTSPNYEFYWELADYEDYEAGDGSILEKPVTKEVADYTFARGLSIWVTTATAINFTQSGAVNPKEVTYTVGNGFVQAGNCHPTDLTLSQLVFNPNVARNDNIQIFNKDGDLIKKLTYKRRGTSPNYEFYWELADYEDYEAGDGSILAKPVVSEVDPTKFIFKPSQHFWLNLENEGTVTIPAIQL